MQLDLFNEVKNSGQDFEWYPTTQEMFRTIGMKLRLLRGTSHETFSMLDIGAGDGRSFDAIIGSVAQPGYHIISTKYAIEKSDILLSAMPADVCVVGTDFHQQTLIDKSVDVVFCNPPYSEYETWASRIILEANAKHVFLVIPTRWKESARISDAIKKREATVNSIGSFDFLHADRKARAVVNILHVYMGMSWRSGRGGVDPFNLWFDETFKIDVGEKENEQSFTGKQKAKEERAEKIKSEVVKGRNQVQVMSVLYRQELDNMLDNYRQLEKLDGDILRELGVSLGNLKEGLKLKINGLKSSYWKELFAMMKQMTDRLTSKTRKAMLEKMNTHLSVDFDEPNAYAVIVWALKNANIYIDDQLKDVYLTMTSEENARVYKSNRHMTKDSWRYLRRHKDDGGERPHHYALDYRIVLSGFRAIMPNDAAYSWEFKNNLAESAHEYIGDILTICNNLGFPATHGTHDCEWQSNVANEFWYMKNGKRQMIASVKAFKNGNIHIKFATEVIEAINTEAARLFGWVKSPQEAAEEAGLKNAASYWKSNFKVTKKLLLTM